MAKKEKSPSEQIQEIKKEGIAKGKELALTYDSFAEGLEPSYYWVLDFLREDLGYSVEKIYDQYAAAEASSYYGDLAVRRQQIEKRAMEIMGTLAAVVRSILQLLWDMREFELRLDHYDKSKSKDKEEVEAADNALKAIWLTEVDIKKGRGSINLLTQDLHFVTLRDAFMVAKSVKDVEKMDLNDRVKRVLKGKVKEYLDWRKMSEAELRKRYQVEKAWLRAQVNSMKLYTRWARPYLIAAKKLMPIEGPRVGAEELVTAFDVARIDLIIFGQKEIEEGSDIFSCIEVEFRYRAVPSGEPGKGRIMHRGKVEMFFKPYVFTKEEIGKIKALEEDEVLQFLEGMTTESLQAMHGDLAKYIEEISIDKIKEKIKKLKTKEEKIKYLEGLKEIEDPEIKKEVEKRLKLYKIKLPFAEEIKGVIEPFKEFSETLKALKVEKEKPKKITWKIEKLRKKAKERAGDDCWDLYNTYKDAHKMIKW